MQVDQVTEGDSFVEKTEAKDENNELEKYRKDGQEFINSYQRLLTTFAKDVSLDFKLSSGFYIDLEKGEINMDAKWFQNKDFSKDQLLWATMHELSHFRDLANDPEKMMDNFKYIRTQAKKTGSKMMSKYEEKFGASDPDFIEQLKKQKPTSKKDPSQTMNSVETVAYKIHHTFYNIFDDIYVNNLVSRNAPKYEDDSAGGKEISDLYQNKLFAGADYQKSPRHLQFLYKLLREEMVKDEEVIVTPEVQDVMDTQINFMGKQYTPREIVESFIKPKKKRDTKAGQRYLVLQRTLEPIFEELLAKDLDEWDPEMPPEKPKDQTQGGQGDGETDDSSSQEGDDGEKGDGEPGDPNPFADDYDQYDENNPDQISEDDLKDYVEKKGKDNKKDAQETVAKEAEENKSTEEKANQAQDTMDKKWCDENEIDHSAFQRFKQIEQSIEPYLNQLSVLWEKIIYGSRRDIKRGMEGHYKSGTELDIQKVIEEFPQIESGKLEEARIYKKSVAKEVLVQKPDLIRVRLVGDMSSSMDKNKIKILQQSFILILSSLQEFNTKLNLTRSQTKSNLSVDTEAWAFGSEAWKIKKLRSESNNNNEKRAIIELCEQLQNSSGTTRDDKPLIEIGNSLSEKDKKGITEEKIMEIVIEITDGWSDNPQATRQAVDNLVNSGVITRAFQIGETDDKDNKKFNEVWNEERADNFGVIVGENIKNLIPAITKILEQYLSNVRL